MEEKTNKTVTDDKTSVDKDQEVQKAVTGEEGLTEEQKIEETKKLQEEEDHKERSKLGRRLSAMEQEAEARGTRLDATLDKMEAFLSSNPNANATTETDYDEPLTKKDIDKFMEDREYKTKIAQGKYEQGYLQYVSKLGQQEDPEFHEEIQEEMMKNFNVKYSRDPVADAERNYLRATRAILKKGSPSKENPLKGNKPKSALGVAGDTQMKDNKEFVMPALDEDAKDFIKRKGLSEEQVKKYLSSKETVGLSRTNV